MPGETSLHCPEDTGLGPSLQKGEKGDKPRSQEHGFEVRQPGLATLLSFLKRRDLLLLTLLSLRPDLEACVASIQTSFSIKTQRTLSAGLSHRLMDRRCAAPRQGDDGRKERGRSCFLRKPPPPSQLLRARRREKPDSSQYCVTHRQTKLTCQTSREESLLLPPQPGAMGR